MRKKSLLLGSTLILLLGTACSTGTTNVETEQSVESACQMIYDSLAKLETDLDALGGSDSTEDLVAMVEVASANLQELDKRLVNPEVKALWDPIATLQREGLEAAAHEDQEALMAAYLEMSESYEAFTEVCPSE